MVNGIRFKVCGLTNLADAELADRCGADFLGFIFYSKSPRGILPEQYRAMDGNLPDRKRVAVMVAPRRDDLASIADLGFDFYQIHFPEGTSIDTVRSWSEVVGPERLILAPRLLPGTRPADELYPLANTFLWDTYQAGGFGGSGHTGDWTTFSETCKGHPEKQWILAGGLNPDNIAEALRTTGARMVDVNSGVEAAPGLKDEAKLKTFCAALATV